MSGREKWALFGSLAVVTVSSVAIVVILAVAARTSAAVTQPALEASTARAFNAPFPSRCEGVDTFACEVSDQSGSGTSPYQVTVTGSCWEATIDGPQGGEVPMPDTAQGCVTGLDHIAVRFPMLLLVT